MLKSLLGGTKSLSSPAGTYFRLILTGPIEDNMTYVPRNVDIFVGNEEENVDGGGERDNVPAARRKAGEPTSPAADDCIYCSKCVTDRHYGCQIPGHEVIFDDSPNFEIGHSKIPNTGMGVCEGAVVNMYRYDCKNF